MIKAYAVFEPGGELKKFKYDPGDLKNDEVEINVRYCGICHSDLSMINNDWACSEYPLVPGHEVIGTVNKIGKDVKNLKVGDLVGLGWHSGYCMHCASCLAGDFNLCAEAEATIVSHHGGFADKVRAHAPSVIKLPAEIDLESAGPLFCGGIIVFNPLVQFNVKPTDRVGVIGIGGLGHLAVQFLHAWGCEVTAFSSTDSKRDEIMKLGADHMLNSRSREALEGHAGYFDFIISTVNKPLDWNLYIQALKPKGRLHFVGVVPAPLNIMAPDLISGQRSISGSPVGAPGNIKKMLDFAQKHKIKPVIEKYPFNKVNEAIEHLKSGKARYRIVLY